MMLHISVKTAVRLLLSGPHRSESDVCVGLLDVRKHEKKWTVTIIPA